MKRLLIIFLFFTFSFHAQKQENKSLPKDALKKYLLGIKNGDKELFKSSIHASKKYVDAMSATVDMATALFKYQKALKEKYPTDKSVDGITNSFGNFEDIEKQVNEVKIEVNGDKAVSIPQKKGELAVNFIKINNVWKLDYSKMEAQFGDLQVMAMNNAIPKIINHIEKAIKQIEETDVSPDKTNKSIQNTVGQIIQEEATKLVKERQGK